MTENANERFERLAAAFHEATGFLAPGKDDPLAMEEDAELRQLLWRVFLNGVRYEGSRAAPREPGEAERRLVPGLGGLQVRYNCALPTGCAFGDSGARLIATFNAAMAAPRPDAGDGTGEP